MAIKQVQRYKTSDGREFLSKTEAIRHDKKVLEVEAFFDRYFPRRFRTCDFSNGHGYIQLTQHTHLKLKAEFAAMLKRFHPKLFKEVLPHFFGGYVGRYLGDTESPLYQAWNLVNQIDDRGRVWGQPYFVGHPEDAPEQRPLNKVAI